jgi:hypothetical protein
VGGIGCWFIRAGLEGGGEMELREDNLTRISFFLR